MPVIGDIQGFAEAETARDYIFATIGVIPGAGDVVQKGRAAKIAYDTAKTRNDVNGMKKAMQEGVDALREADAQKLPNTPTVSQPMTGGQAQRQVQNGQAVPIGYTRDRQGRLRDGRGRYVSDINNPRVGTNLSRPDLRVGLKSQVMANYEILPNGAYRHRVTRQIVQPPPH
ncbi:hypothetical protein LU293_00045 [Moraxella nasovis]|uniref:hypothetical protein n=1 Tax=Moraxella nasovis TaxID=2904121 RepID=UPI001F624F71|nr:hypothetical protein [Moraxella nasovis]UNU73344.1 hypothetical protein LU293_00045 [Moraxella nasovis]